MQGRQAIRELYPFESKFLTIGGQRLHYIDEGQGPTVLLLHGNPTWSFYYRNLILALREDHRVIVPDHMGCGFSEKPQRYRYTLEHHIDNLERLLQRLQIDGPLTLGVHDWGGPIGFGYADRHPERIGRLVIFNTAVFLGDVPRRIRLCGWPLIGQVLVRGLNAFVRGAVSVGCQVPGRMTDEVKSAYLLPYGSYRERVAILAFVRDIPRRRSHPNHAFIMELDRGLPRFRDRPAIILWGARDFCFTEDFLEGWMERLPGAEVHILEDAGHLVLEDAHERIVPLVRDFLRRTAATLQPLPATAGT